MLAAKLMDDKYYNNAFYAKVGGIATSELNHMELEMLQLLDYRLLVSTAQMKQLLGRLEVLQSSGRLVSVLCRKRSEHVLDSISTNVAPSMPPGGHNHKVAKSHTSTQQFWQPLQASVSTPGIVSQNISDSTAKHGSIQPQAVTQKTDSASFAKCGHLSGKSSSLPINQHVQGCLSLQHALLIDVGA